MNFLDKLNHLMELHNLNKNTFAKNSGIPYTTIDAFYKKGYQNAKLPTIQKIAKYFDVTLDYLMLDEIMNMHYGKSEYFKVDAEEMYLIKKYRLISLPGKKLVNINISKVLEYENELKKLYANKSDLPLLQ